MTGSDAQKWVLGAWIAMIAMITARNTTQNKGLPPPSVYLGSAVLYTVLWGSASFLGSLAVALAIGIDIGGVLVPYLEGQKSGGVVGGVTAFLKSISGVAAAQQANAPNAPKSSTGNAPRILQFPFIGVGHP